MTCLFQVGTLNRKTLVLDPLYFDKDLTQYIRTKNRSRLQQNILKIEAQLKTLITKQYFVLRYGYIKRNIAINPDTLAKSLKNCCLQADWSQCFYEIAFEFCNSIMFEAKCPILSGQGK